MKEKEILLEQYKLFVEMADSHSNRRNQSNNFLFTINSLVLTIYGTLISFADLSLPDMNWVRILASLIGIIFCIAWIRLIINFKKLSEAKFKVIHEMEELLAAYKPYTKEWEYAKTEETGYKSVTDIEPFIPYILIALYVLLAIYPFISF